MLMGHHSLWQVGISYLDYCPMYGIATMELLLMRLPLHNESRTMKIIKEAQKRQLAEIGACLNKCIVIFKCNFAVFSTQYLQNSDCNICATWTIGKCTNVVNKISG